MANLADLRNSSSAHFSQKERARGKSGKVEFGVVARSAASRQLSWECSFGRRSSSSSFLSFSVLQNFSSSLLKLQALIRQAKSGLEALRLTRREKERGCWESLARSVLPRVHPLNVGHEWRRQNRAEQKQTETRWTRKGVNEASSLRYFHASSATIQLKSVPFRVSLFHWSNTSGLSSFPTKAFCGSWLAKDANLTPFRYSQSATVTISKETRFWSS